jgi:hypothetical protein
LDVEPLFEGKAQRRLHLTSAPPKNGLLLFVASRRGSAKSDAQKNVHSGSLSADSSWNGQFSPDKKMSTDVLRGFFSSGKSVTSADIFQDNMFVGFI